MKQCVEPESTKALKIMVFGRSEVVTGKNRALGSKGAAALRRTSSIARSISSQPEVRLGSKRLLQWLKKLPQCLLTFERSIWYEVLT